MPPRRKHPSADFRGEATRWLAYARGDLESATALHEARAPNRNVGYLAQQAVEKALKAVILLANAPFELTHDLTAIAVQLPRGFAAPIPVSALAWLADIETSARYPDEGDTITADDAARALGLGEIVLAAVQAWFKAQGAEPTVVDSE